MDLYAFLSAHVDAHVSYTSTWKSNVQRYNPHKRDVGMCSYKERVNPLTLHEKGVWGQNASIG